MLFRARRSLKRAYSKAAAFLPLPAFLGRRAKSASRSLRRELVRAQAQGTAAQLTAVSGDHAASLVHKAAAVVAAVTVVGGGTVAIEQAGVNIPVLDSIAAKKDHDSKAAGTAGPRRRKLRRCRRCGSRQGGRPRWLGPTRRRGRSDGPGRGGAGSPAALASPRVAGAGGWRRSCAPETAAPGTTAPGNSAPASPVSGGGGSNGSQGNQPASGKVDNGGGSGGGGSSNSTKGGSGQTDSQPLTTPAGEPIPPQLPAGIQHQLESGKRTLDDLPPGLKT